MCTVLPGTSSGASTPFRPFDPPTLTPLGHCYSQIVDLYQIHSAHVGRRWLEAPFALQYFVRCASGAVILEPIRPIYRAATKFER